LETNEKRGRFLMTLNDFSNNMFLRMALMFEKANKWALDHIITDGKDLNSYNVTKKNG
jgi:hypothetical protein